MLVRLILGFLADLVFESAAARTRSYQADMTQYLAGRRRAARPAPRKPI
jgi:hypothetical protein